LDLEGEVHGIFFIIYGMLFYLLGILFDNIFPMSPGTNMLASFILIVMNIPLTFILTKKLIKTIKKN